MNEVLLQICKFDGTEGGGEPVPGSDGGAGFAGHRHVDGAPAGHDTDTSLHSDAGSASAAANRRSGQVALERVVHPPTVLLLHSQRILPAAAE